MVAGSFPSSSPRRSQGNWPFQAFQTTWLSTRHSMLIFSSQLLHHPRLGLDQQGHLGHHIQGQLGLFLHLSQRMNIRLNASSGSTCSKGERQYLVNWHGYRPSETIGSHLLIWAMLMKLLKAWEDERPSLHGIVQDAIEMFLESITIGFEPERFSICITSDKEVD